MANASGKRSYEEQWQQAFEKAEMPPSPDIWKNIDQQLTAQEGGKYKRGFFFYRAVAAVLLLCIAGLGWFVIEQQSETANIAQQKDRATTETSTSESGNAAGKTEHESALAQREPSPAQSAEKEQLPEETLSEGLDQENSSVAGDHAAGRPLATIDEPRSSDTESGNAAQVYSAARDATNQSTSKTLIFPNEEVSRDGAELHPSNHRVGRLAVLSPDALALAPPAWADSIKQLYYVPQYRDEESPNRDTRDMKFFAGISMAPSYFDPNFQSPGRGNMEMMVNAPNEYSLDAKSLQDFQQSSIANNVQSTVIQEGLENQSTLSLSYGFDVGLALGEHWSLESGLDYQNFQTNTQTNYTVVDLQTGDRYPLVASNALQSRATYANTTPMSAPEEVASNFQFVSVPLRVGYNVQFSKVTLSVSPGVAANFFLGNEISSDRYSSATIDSDGSSPFNSRYLSGLISGGVFYQLLESYSISLTPSYQFALSELAKSSADFSSLPQSFGLKMGFRYNFQ